MRDATARPGSISQWIPLVAMCCYLPAAAAGNADTEAGEWRSLFDGKTLDGWRETQFTGRGQVRVENGSILLGRGKPMTGVTWAGQFPRSDYEVRFEGMRIDGNDFFATLTFPVEDSFCTWVTGGWGGDIVGLSSIDGWDASDNETRIYFNFENGRWYALRLRVTADRIMAWIDGRRVINVEIRGRTIGLRHGETKLSAPFGFASYATAGAVRKIEYRLLPASGARGKMRQQPELLRGQLHFLTVAEQFVRGEVQLVISEAEHGLLPGFASPQESVDSRHQFADLERFRHIVVGAQVEP